MPEQGRSMLEEAKRLVELGFAVFPIWPAIQDADGVWKCACSLGEECKDGGKHPACKGGLRSASKDPAQLRRWWSGRAAGNSIGIATGAASGVIVIDVDPDKGGADSILDLPKIPDTVEALTGRLGGRHIYLRHPGAVVQNATDQWPGVDVRGDGGYVVAPPSTHVSGRRYEWEVSSDPFDGVQFANMPEWLLAELGVRRSSGEAREELTGSRHGRSSGRKFELPSWIAYGTRNDTLFRYACRLRGRGAEAPEIAAELAKVYEERCEKEPVMGPNDFRAIAQSAGRLEANAIPRERAVPSEPWDAPEPGRRLIDTLPSDGLPQIETNSRQLRDITRDALGAILASNDPPHIFVRAGELVRVVDDEVGRPTIQPVTGVIRAGVLARVADWISTSSKRGTVQVAPPKAVVDDLSTLVPWTCLPALRNVSPCPVASRTGGIREIRGYDPETLMYVATKGDWPHVDMSGPNAAEWLVTEVLHDFVFADSFSIANALALMILPFVRPLIDEPVPFHLFDAPEKGSGKGKLAEACLMPGLGPAQIKPPPAKEEEWTKILSSALSAGLPALIIDNLAGKIDSPSLLAALTSTIWGDRVFGSNSAWMVLPNRCIWVGTSNNADLISDMVDRTVYIRLNPAMENPSDRKGFKHPYLISWMQANRPQIGATALAMVRHWIAAGRPEGKKTNARFPMWAAIVGGILDVCGVPGFMGNVDALRAANDDERALWRQFLRDWRDAFQTEEVTVGQLVSRLEGTEALRAILGGEQDSAKRAHRLGMMLRHRIDRVFGDSSVSRGGKSEGGRRFKLTILADATDASALFGSLRVGVSRFGYPGAGADTYNVGPPEASGSVSSVRSQVQTDLFGPDATNLASGDEIVPEARF